MAGAEIRNPDEPFARIDVERTKELIAAGAAVIDVREPDEWNKGHIPVAALAPLQQFMMAPHNYLEQDNIVFVCAVGQRSAIACEMAAAMGLEQLYNLEGGTIAWMRANEPTTIPDPPVAE